MAAFIMVASQIINITDMIDPMFRNIIIGILCAGLGVIGIYFLSSRIGRISKKIWISCIIFVSALIPRLIILFYTSPVPFSDFEQYYKNAVQMAAGDIHGILLKDFPDLLGFIKWESILVSLFGDSYLTLQVISCVTVSLLCVVIFLLFGKVSIKVGVLTALLYAFYPPHIFGSAILTNQHVFSLLCYAAVYLLFINTKCYYKKIILSVCGGILIGGAQIIRPEGPTVLLAFILFMIYLAFTNKEIHKKMVLRLLLPCVLTAAYLLVTTAFSLYMYKSGFTEKLFASTDMRYKFCVGLNIETLGSYSGPVSEEFFKSDDAGREKMLREKIKYYRDDPKMSVVLAGGKIATQYALVESSYFFLLNNKAQGEYGGLKEWYYRLSQPFYLCILLLGLYAFWRKRKHLFSNMEILLLLMVLVRLGVYLLIEVQPRYRLFDMPVFFYFAALGINELRIKYVKSNGRKTK